MKEHMPFRIFTLIILLTSSTIAAIACLGNITDPDSNMLFVSHIFKMDTTYQAPNLMWRALEAPFFHWAGFGFIILIEFLITALGFICLFKLSMNIKASEEVFNSHKAYGFYAFALCIFVWGFIFQAAGGEWFASWQSEHWNGLRDATRIAMLALCGGISLRLAK